LPKWFAGTRRNRKNLVVGVTASRALIEKAIDAKADAILVHHGWFWKSDDVKIVGQLYDRLSLSNATQC
jgi:putative NIF3 family GTP cyclohydrolase 1 type 2